MGKGLKKLQKEALISTNFRGHSIKWDTPYHGESKSIRLGTCKVCGAWVQINTKPLPNGVDIGGPAVALNCSKPENKTPK